MKSSIRQMTTVLTYYFLFKSTRPFCLFRVYFLIFIASDRGIFCIAFSVSKRVKAKSSAKTPDPKQAITQISLEKMRKTPKVRVKTAPKMSTINPTKTIVLNRPHLITFSQSLPKKSISFSFELRAFFKLLILLTFIESPN